MALGEARKEELIQAYAKNIKAIQERLDEQYQYHDATVFRTMRFQSAHFEPTPTVIFRIKAAKSLLNYLDVLHGGAIALIFDCCTSLALGLLEEPGFRSTLRAVSRSLNCSYLDPVPGDAEVEVSCEIVKVSSKLAHLRGIMRIINHDGSFGKIAATCEHGKAITSVTETSSSTRYGAMPKL